MASVVESRVPARPPNGAAWLPLVILSVAATLLTVGWPSWVFMWALAVSIYAGLKWLIFADCAAVNAQELGRSLAHLLLWPGMDAKSFFASSNPVKRPMLSEWLFAIGKLVVGALLVAVAVHLVNRHSMIAGWVGMTGIAFSLHFGLFHVLSVPKVLDWKVSLDKLDGLSRQLAWVHGVFIVFVIVGFGLFSVVFASDLATGTPPALYTSKQGGFIIDGKASKQNGNYKVEINGCEGVALEKKVVLKPGERRVVNLADNPAPNNVFIALEAPVSEQAKQFAEAMKANTKTFRLELNYNGEQRKPFYRLILSVPVVNRRRNSPFNRIVQVKEDEAIRIINHLARDGFFDGAHTSGKLEKLAQPCYLLTAHAGDLDLTEIIGWGLPMINRLDDLRVALPDSGKSDMDFLLGRLSGLRRQWEAEQPAVEATGTGKR